MNVKTYIILIINSRRKPLKASFLRKNILEKGIDAEKFVDFLQGNKGEDGAGII